MSGVPIANFKDPESTKSIIQHVQKCILQIMSHFAVPPMDEARIMDSLDLIMEKHFDWTVEDFTVFSKSVRMGNITGIPYPKSYNRIDPDMIMEFANIYNQAKVEAREKIIQQENGARIMQEREELKNLAPNLKEESLSLKPFIDKLDEMIRQRKPEFYGTGNPEKLREELQTEVKPVLVADNTDKMLKRIESNAEFLGVEYTRAQLQEFINPYKDKMIPLPAWMEQAEDVIKKVEDRLAEKNKS